MGRALRVDVGGEIYHVLNRANARVCIFRTRQDFEAFDRILTEAVDRIPMRILEYCVMPNHWHFVLQPWNDGDLSKFIGWLSLTHTQRHHAAKREQGYGHLYQGRFKSFLVESDEYLSTLCRYVVYNPVKDSLVQSVEDWEWGSFCKRRKNVHEGLDWLIDWDRPKDWESLVSKPLPKHEELQIENSITRGTPYGSDEWVATKLMEYELQCTWRPRGRPSKKVPDTFSGEGVLD